ncbi:Gp138 family membrane-puncturing spike protein [Mycoavidus sp. SF9855]|uniref:Gp138 family membrane-puncturing spike protein n=1 Tax=Mycoavidus sp. SF9855 TaxID=2968475 RepID=UPI00211C8A9B|nr:Gp138 family membrane-puncturing spike protein [Mycoavidus sp. SF9855]UUM20923.1 hypothetical protein NQD60_05425 [Mycoavidus sp. SF9855]
MNDNAIPSHDPANAGGLAGTLREVFKKFMQGVDDMLPAKIVTYDHRRNVATVQPQIRVLTTENETVSRPLLVSVPVLALGGGDFVLSFPLKPGDTGWIKANDRDISLYLQSGTEAGPNTQRLHSFSDGLFIPHVMGHYTLAEEDATHAVLQSTDGAVRISLSSDKIKITAPTIELQAAEVNCTGNFTTNGRVIGRGGVTFGDTPAESHCHNGVRSGIDISGGPV